MTRLVQPIGCSLLFILTALLLIPYPGIQNDEALFGAGLYEQGGGALAVTAFGQKIPLMLMAYLGGLKSVVYAGVFQLWHPSVRSIRWPMMLAGAATIWLFYLFLAAAATPRAALAGGLLLATDPTFVMTTCFDWGPVAIQHLLLVAAMGLASRFYKLRQDRFLYAAMFLCGLALWDKALSIWIASGLFLSVWIVFPRQIRDILSLRGAICALCWLLLGASPLVVYNLNPASPFETLRANQGYTLSEFVPKLTQLRKGLDGSALFGYMASVSDWGSPREPESPAEKVSVWISRHSGGQRRGLMPYALLGALALLPLLWKTPGGQAMRFAFLAMAIAWFQMAITRNAGGSAHHVVLLWPLPQMIVAIGVLHLREFEGGAGNLPAHSRRIARVACTAVLVLLAGANILVCNEYLAQFTINGTAGSWTDALLPLSIELPTVPAKDIYITDWGIFDSVCLLTQGTLPLREGLDALSKPVVDAVDRKTLIGRMSNPDAVFAGFTDGNEQFAGVNQRLRDVAQTAGFRKESLRVIRDRNGRYRFEVFRFLK